MFTGAKEFSLDHLVPHFQLFATLDLLLSETDNELTKQLKEDFYSDNLCGGAKSEKEGQSYLDEGNQTFSH